MVNRNTPSPSRRISKSVSFSDNDDYQTIDMRQEYSAEERKNTWYVKEDIIRMQQEAGKKILIEMDRYPYSNDSDEDREEEKEERGIENFASYKTYVEIKRRRKLIIREVVLSQDQTGDNMMDHNENFIASMYFSKTRKEAMKAQNFGVSDATDAMDIYMKDGMLSPPCVPEREPIESNKITSERREKQFKTKYSKSLSRRSSYTNSKLHKVMTDLLHYFVKSEYSM